MAIAAAMGVAGPLVATAVGMAAEDPKEEGTMGEVAQAAGTTGVEAIRIETGMPMKPAKNSEIKGGLELTNTRSTPKQADRQKLLTSLGAA